MSSERKAALGLPQLGLGFLADRNSWNVNEKPQNREAGIQEYCASCLLTMFFTQTSALFAVRL